MKSHIPLKKSEFSFLSLGSNIGNRITNITNSLKILNEDSKTKIISKSHFYQTEPLYNKKQSDFINIVVKIHTSQTLIDFFNSCKKVEKKMGRDFKIQRNSPRVIDIDILTFNDSTYSDDNITIPHPKIHERKFVLIPWVEIDPNYYLVNYKKNVTSLLNNTKDISKVVKL